MKQDIVRYPACFYSMLHNRFACRDDAFRWSTVNRRLLVLSGWANACVDLNLRPRALAYLSRAAPHLVDPFSHPQMCGPFVLLLSFVVG